MSDGSDSPRCAADGQMIVRSEQKLASGRTLTTWELINRSGAGVAVMDLGATLLSVSVPDRRQKLGDVTLCHARLDDYLTHRQFFGGIVGRYANRLAGASFRLGGQSFRLQPNEGPNLLHGGEDGFDRRFWRGDIVETPDGEGVRLEILSPDGDQGFPGELRVTVTYVWTEDNCLITDFSATTTRPCPVNLTLHGYWNLGGDEAGNGIGEHQLQLFADQYLPRTADGIPTGSIESVTNTPFDFRVSQPISNHLERLDGHAGGDIGIDHCWAVRGSGLRPAALLYDPASGRTLTIDTDQPGIQVYTADHLDATILRRGGLPCEPRCAIALETQQFPDAPNQPDFPDPTLRPETIWHSRTVYSFSVR